MNGSAQAQNKIEFTVNGKPFLFKMTYDVDNVCDNDMISEFRSNGICEPEVVCAMERIVRPGDTVIDGGANIGFFTVYLALLVGPAGKVIAVEPGQNNLWKLEENVRINGLKNVEIIRKPLWHNNERVALFMRQASGRNSLFPGDSWARVEIEGCALSDLPTARLIKLDIEGSEVAALHTWDRRGFVICEMNEWALERLGGSQQALRAYGDTFLLQKDGNLPMFVPPGTKIVTDRPNTNVLLSTIEGVAEVWKEVRV